MKKKILLWLNADLIDFCMSYYLQKITDAEFYAIIDITNKPKKFFNKQKLVQFKKIWFYHDHIKTDKPLDLDHLTDIEKRFNLNLWELSLNERIFYLFNEFHKFTRHEILSILDCECTFFDKILHEVKPDFFITNKTALHHEHLFYIMCKSNGVKTFMLSQPNLGYRYMISSSENPGVFDSLKTLDDTQSTNRTLEDLTKYLDGASLETQIKNYRSEYRKSKNDKLNAFKNFIINKNLNIKSHYTYSGRTKYRVLKSELVASFRRKKRKNFIDHHLKSELPSTPFVYFALGVDEERHILLSAPFYTNQIETIRNIAKAMPIKFQLVVKENPNQEVRDWRKISEYKEMLQIPNVTLLHPSFPTKKIYQACSIVITTGGTTGFEGAFYGKPSIILSDLGYQILPSVYRLDSAENLSQTIKKALETKFDVTALDKYINFIEKNTFVFHLKDLENKYHNAFYFGGNLVDVDISIDTMKKFLEENKSDLMLLANEYMKKINLGMK